MATNDSTTRDSSQVQCGSAQVLEKIVAGLPVNALYSASFAPAVGAVTPVPEPVGLFFLAEGLLVLALNRRRFTDRH